MIKVYRELFSLIRNNNPVSKEILVEAEEMGMIPKRNLVDGRSYVGHCRNANIAEWHEKKNCFIHLRTKFSNVFAEKINHPEDDDGFDVFVPVKEILIYE